MVVGSGAADLSRRLALSQSHNVALSHFRAGNGHIHERPHPAEENTRTEEQVVPALKTVIYPVKDLTQAKAQYAALLGTDPVMDEPYYVQFNVEGQEIGLDPNGHGKGMTGPVGYWHVEDITGTVATLLTAGATERQPVTDLGGRQIASVADADGNVIGLLQTS